jgi:hypothetical protein
MVREPPTEKENLIMKTVSAIARYLSGVIFLVFGLNGFLNFIPMPPPRGIAGQFMGALYASHYLWVIFAFQLIAGVLLLVSRYVPLAVAVLAPVIVNILSFHALMAPSGLPLALFVAVLLALIFVNVRRPLPDYSNRACSDKPDWASLNGVPNRRPAMTNDRKILITGVTGNQGGAVAQALQGSGFQLCGLTRKPDSQRAAALALQGIDIVKSDLDDEATLRRALAGTWGVFGAQNAGEAGVEREEA